MSRVLVIGAGGVGSVAVHKMAMNADIFTHISLASRTKSKCDAIAASVKKRTGVAVDTYEIDAEEVPALTRLIEAIKPALVVNLALPYQDLAIMDACLAAGVHYMDTANYEPKDEAKFEYHWQWAYQDRFKDAGLMALLAFVHHQVLSSGVLRGRALASSAVIIGWWKNANACGLNFAPGLACSPPRA